MMMTRPPTVFLWELTGFPGRLDRHAQIQRGSSKDDLFCVAAATGGTSYRCEMRNGRVASLVALLAASRSGGPWG